jgi:dTDP-4-dehydrorhamnose 3,5-epimerase
VIFKETGLNGSFLIQMEPKEDVRGSFARSWCKREAEAHGIDVDWVQCNVSLNRKKGTLRGMHYQFPRWEAKLVRVTRGSVFDVMVDLRPSSPTYKRHFTAVLSASNHTMFFIPEGFAHGFLSLEDDTEIFYQMSEYYIADQTRGFRWDDPQFAIPWPEGAKILSERDRDLPVYTPQ